MSGTTAAIDLGGTHVRAALVAEDGTITNRVRHRTPAADPRPDILPVLIAEVSAGAPGGAIDRVVIGVPGVVDHEREALVRAPNLPENWIGHLRGDWLAAQIGCPVSLANDADLAAVGEARFGAGRASRDVVYVTISTGVGAGMVVAGSLVRGTLSGGEIGHTVIDFAAAKAGRPSTVEELGAGPAIAKAAAEAGLVERDEQLAALARSGHDEAVRIWTTAIEAVGFGVANMAWLLAPQIVVIGGGVGANQDLVLPIISRVLAASGPAVDEPIQVVAAELGDDAGLVGAAAWFEAVGRADVRGSDVGR